MSIVFLSLGSNVGDRAEFFNKAVQELVKFHIEILKKSAIYETEPVGVMKQPWFLNMAVKVRTNLSPQELLSVCKKIEENLGRKKRRKWAKREIDIDILLYERKTINNDFLVIPHKELLNRRFVLVPLNEIAPHKVIPQYNLTVQQALSRCKDRNKVVQYN